MRNKVTFLLVLVTALTVGFSTSARAEHHRATHLGHPATRFAPPLVTPDDLRARFANPKLHTDIAAILEQWQWEGNLNDLFQAAATAEITPVEIPVGETMPFMSSRDNGKPVCLRNVTWAGKAPIAAFAFNFTSNGHRYRCVTPKPCSNFFLEDLGPELKPALALDCSAPAKAPATRPVNVCLTLHNTGNDTEASTVVALPVPAGTTATNVTGGGVVAPDRITWTIANLAPNSAQQVCAGFAAPAGDLAFNATASGSRGETAQTACGTSVFSVHAILAEVVDLRDPVEVGKEITYVVTVTNQGDTPETNIRVVCTLPDSQEFVLGKGDTAVTADGKTVTMDPLPSLAGKGVASWRVGTKALKVADSRFKVAVTSDQFTNPIQREESTQLY
jgi:uncharacterized repeat protein (TIGR01451 family)